MIDLSKLKQMTADLEAASEHLRKNAKVADASRGLKARRRQPYETEAHREKMERILRKWRADGYPKRVISAMKMGVERRNVRLVLYGMRRAVIMYSEDKQCIEDAQCLTLSDTDDGFMMLRRRFVPEDLESAMYDVPDGDSDSQRKINAKIEEDFFNFASSAPVGAVFERPSAEAPGETPYYSREAISKWNDIADQMADTVSISVGESMFKAVKIGEPS